MLDLLVTLAMSSSPNFFLFFPFSVFIFLFGCLVFFEFCNIFCEGLCLPLLYNDCVLVGGYITESLGRSSLTESL